MKRVTSVAKPLSARCLASLPDLLRNGVTVPAAPHGNTSGTGIVEEITAIGLEATIMK